jgi:hypothetical protein
MKKVVIYPKDIMIVTGKSERYSRKLLQNIKTVLKKKDHQVVTINEFCEYIGITIDEVSNVLK